MKPSSISKSLHHLLDARRPSFIWGPPGAGKSDVVAQVAAARKVELRDVRLSLLDPVDLKGFPVPNTTKKLMEWLPADFLPTKGKGILFLDEMNSAPQAVQAGAYQLILNRKIGNYTLPAGWDVLAAGNRASDRSVVHAMPAALANRFVHLDFEVDLADWCTWAAKAGIHTDVIAFLRFRENLLHSYDAKSSPRAFPSPRTWAFVNDIYKGKEHLAKNLALDIYSGTVGEGPASEFMAFVDIIKDLPSVDQIKLDPTKTPVPDSPATLYALTTSLAAAANPNNFDVLMQYVSRIQTEFQVVFMKDSLARDDSVAKTKAFADWGVKFGYVLL